VSLPLQRRLTRAALATAAAAALTAATTPAAAAPALPRHRPAPSAHQLAASRAAVAHRLAQLRSAERRLGVARSQLAHARLVAEIASEKYDAAHTRLVAAEQRLSTDRATLSAAIRAVERARRVTARFAVAAYETGGLQGLEIVSDNGPAQVIDRIGAQQAVAVGRDEALAKFRAAQIVETTVTRQAQQAQTAAAQATAAAAKAFNSARRAANAAEGEVGRVRAQRVEVSRLLTRAQAHARTLRREHLAALARAAAAEAARAEAARLAAATPTTVSTAPTTSSPSPYTHTTGNLGGTVDAATEQRAVQAAMSQIGKPYQWAAAGPNTYDCSGLTMWAYDQVGVHLLHYTGDQWVEGAHIAQSQLRPGDLVFFAYNTSDPSTIHHVGMYIGNGQMVDAPYTGADVRTESAFEAGYIGAVRPYRT